MKPQAGRQNRQRQRQREETEIAPLLSLSMLSLHSAFRTPYSAFRIPHSALLRPSVLLWWVGLLPAFWTLTTLSASAQFEGAGGWAIQLYGMVQVEPGTNVLTLGVKNEEIRFVVHDVRCSNREFSAGRFLSDTTHRTPGVYIKGPDTMLDILIKEKPSTRVLKLSGFYYPDSRRFVLNGLEP